jgi:hypothetical protein
MSNPSQNPTLLPNFSQAVSLGKTLVTQSPAQLLAANARVSASLALTVGSSVSADDILNVVLSNPVFPSGSIALTVTATSDDTDATLAEELAAQINTNLLCRQYDVVATSLAGVLTLLQDGPVGNSTAVTTSVSPGSETFSPSSGTLTGGSGPVVPLSNFSASLGLNMMNLRQGQPLQLNDTTVANLVASAANIK